MASRAQEKEQRRHERLAEEKAASEQERRRRIYGIVTAGVLVAAAVGAIVIVVAVGGGSGSKGSVGAADAFGTHYAGLEARRDSARVPTMADAQAVGAAHFHPQVEVDVNGKKIEIPSNIGVDPTKSPLEMAGLHTHDTSGTIHNEAGTSAKLGQFFAVWGVPLSSSQLGPYRAGGSKKVRMWVDGKPSRAFGSLQLQDGQQIVVAYGTRSQMPR